MDWFLTPSLMAFTGVTNANGPWPQPTVLRFQTCSLWLQQEVSWPNARFKRCLGTGGELLPIWKFPVNFNFAVWLKHNTNVHINYKRLWSIPLLILITSDCDWYHWLFQLQTIVINPNYLINHKCMYVIDTIVHIDYKQLW